MRCRVAAALFIAILAGAEVHRIQRDIGFNPFRLQLGNSMRSGSRLANLRSLSPKPFPRLAEHSALTKVKGAKGQRFGLVASAGAKAAENLPKAWMVHAVLCLTQIILGASMIIGKLGLNDCDPATFALYRQLLGAPLLLGLARVCESSNLLPAPLQRRNLGTWLQWGKCGVFVFLIQFCFLTSLAWVPGEVVAAWSPSQAIFTASIAISAGWEKPSLRKVGGIALGSIGGFLLVFLGNAGNSQTIIERVGLSSLATSVIGNSLCFCTCLACSLYLFTSKRALAARDTQEKPRPMALTAVSYCVALVVTLPVYLLILHNCNVRDFFIAPGSHAPPPSWTVPVGAWPALAYCVIFQSVLGYLALTWAVRFLDASTVSLYSVLTPVVACTISSICIAAGYNPHGVLKLPGKNLLGAPFVIGGLLCVVLGNRTKLAR